MLAYSSIWAITWLENEQLITKLGCPVAQPRFTSRPSASTITWWPSGKRHTSVPGLSSSRTAPERARPAMSISLSKWPMLQTMALCFIRSMSSVVKMSVLPVEDTNTSAVSTTSSSVVTWNPSIAACRALIGSISVTITRQPWPRRLCAHPLPTSP